MSTASACTLSLSSSLSLLLVLFLLSLVMESFLLMCVTVAGIFFRANENEEVVMHIDIDGGDGGGRESRSKQAWLRMECVVTERINSNCRNCPRR